MTTVADAGTLPPPTIDRNRRAALAIHLATVPLGFFGSVIIWLVTRKKSLWIRQQALQSLNYQLNVLALKLVTTIMTVLMKPLLEDPNAFILPQPPEFVFRSVEIGLIIYAAIRAYNGRWMPYPKLFKILKPLPDPEAPVA